jgi:hypothetical protein
VFSQPSFATNKYVGTRVTAVGIIRANKVIPNKIFFPGKLNKANSNAARDVKSNDPTIVKNEYSSECAYASRTWASDKTALIFSIPEEKELGYRRGFIAMGIPGLLKTILNIHQMGNNAITRKMTANNQVMIDPTLRRALNLFKVIII